MFFVFVVLGLARAEVPLPSQVTNGPTEGQGQAVFGWMERCPCAEYTPECRCASGQWVLADRRYHPEDGLLWVRPSAEPVEHGRYLLAVSRVAKGRSTHNEPSWTPLSPFEAWGQAPWSLRALGLGGALLLALCVAVVRFVVGHVQHYGASPRAPANIESNGVMRLNLRPWSRWEAVLSLGSAGLWTAVTLVGCLAVCATEWFGVGLLGLALLFEVATSGFRWRHRTHGQLVGACLVGIPLVGAAIMLGYQSALSYGSIQPLGIYGWLLAALATPWVVSRRVGRALTVMLSRFELQLHRRRLRWRLKIGPRTGDWVTVPYDGMHVRVLRTARGLFLDLGGGDGLQITGAGPATAAWLEEHLKGRIEADGADAVDPAVDPAIEDAALDAVRQLGASDRVRPPQPRVGLQPLIASVIGALPVVAVLGIVGAMLARDGVSYGPLFTALLAGGVASGVGAWLADPIPIVPLPVWMHGPHRRRNATVTHRHAGEFR